MNERINNLQHFRQAVIELGLAINPKLFKQEFLENPSEEVMQQIEAKDIEISKREKIKVIYDEMVKDVYDEMEKVFGTRNDVSVTAFAATYEAMLKRPENYIDNELGLNDASAVTAFAQSKISSSDAYGVYRLKRIAHYEAEKAAILNG